MSGSVVETERPEQEAVSTEAPAPAAEEEVIEVEFPAPKRVAIVGFTESRKEAPWGKPGWDLWVCNNLWKFCPNNWHRVYDIHAIKDIQADPEHTAFLAGEPEPHADGQSTVSLGDRPVYVMHKPPAEWRTARLLPKDDCVETFGNYFTNSISWMVAHAMIEIRKAARETADLKLQAAKRYAQSMGENFEQFFGQAAIGLYDAFLHDYERQCAIHVYGVDMATTNAQGGNGEYQNQRPSCEHILGVAQGRGIEVHVPMSSDLLKTSAMYGADDDSALRSKLIARQGELAQRIEQVDGQMNQKQSELGQLQALRHQLQGAAENNQYYLTVWTNTHASRDGTPKDSAPASEADSLPEAA